MPIDKRIYRENMRMSLRWLVNKKNLVGAEIGAGNGTNAKIMLELLHIKKLYLVDIWKSYTENGKKIIVHPDSMESAKKTVKGFNQVVFIQNYSVKVAKQIKNNSLDFVYIDANHQYKYVKQDIKSWFPKVKRGGLIAGHDYGQSGVSQAVDEFLPQREIDRGDWYFFKPCTP